MLGDISFPGGSWILIHDFKVFTCIDGGTFSLEFWAMLDMGSGFVGDGPRVMVPSEDFPGMTGSGSLENAQAPLENWDGYIGPSPGNGPTDARAVVWVKRLWQHQPPLCDRWFSGPASRGVVPARDGEMSTGRFWCDTSWSV